MNQHDQKTRREQLLAMSVEDRTSYIGNSIRKAIANVLEITENEIDVYTPFSSFKTEWENNGEVYHCVKESVEEILERKFYGYELLTHPREQGPLNTINKIAAYLASDMDLPAPQNTFTDPHEGGDFVWPNPDPPAKDRRCPPAAFILSGPRCGSTLLRTMLDGHPDLCVPPEFCLLPFDRMGERQRQIEQFGYTWLQSGPRDTLAQLADLSQEQAQERMTQIEADNTPVQEVYRLFQDLIGERLLIDKSTHNPLRVDWMQRAEQMFESPQYLHLVRHPYAVIESMVRMRFHKHIIGNHFGVWDDNPWLFAEKFWAVIYNNILQFLQTVAPDRHHLIRYEDLVGDPNSVMRGVCGFFGLPFDERILDPYEGERLTGLGDPNIKDRNHLDPTLATAWKKKRPPLELSEFTQNIAHGFGYELS